MDKLIQNTHFWAPRSIAGFPLGISVRCADATSYDAAGCAVIGSIGSAQLAHNVLSLANAVCEVDHCTAFVFRRGAAASAVMTAARLSQEGVLVEQLAKEYVADACQRDPNVRSILSDTRSAPTTLCYVLRPGELRDRALRQRFYEAPHIRQELAFWTVAEPVSLYLSFYRTQACADFSPREMAGLARCGQLASAALLKHAQLLEAPAASIATSSTGAQTPSPRSREQLLARIREALLQTSRTLTPREIDICARIVIGYTTQGIAHTLGIALNTVATHRKRAYYKLGISSQNELFARFVNYVSAAPTVTPETARRACLPPCGSEPRYATG